MGQIGLVVLGHASARSAAGLEGPADSYSPIGVCDGLSTAEVRARFTQGDEMPYVTSMPDGSEVEMRKSLLQPGVQACVDTLAQRGITTMLMGCTGEFLAVKPPAGTTIVFPRDCMIAMARLLLPRLAAGPQPVRIAVLIPHPAQAANLSARYRSLMAPDMARAADIQTFYLSPHTHGAKDAMKQMAQKLATFGAQAVFMECFSYSLADKEIMQLALPNVPIVVARAVSSTIARQLAT